MLRNSVALKMGIGRLSSFLRSAHGPAVFLFALIVLLVRAPGVDRYLVSPDHGYQLSLGQMTLAEGRWPFVDYFYHLFSALVQVIFIFFIIQFCSQ